MDWTADLPRFPLFGGPSPLEPLPRLSAALGAGAEIWVKREDLLPLAFGGNKLRNLEFLVGEALAAGADTLVTSGRRWSNHCRLTAAAGAKSGLDVHLVLGGPPAAAGAEGPNIRIERLIGAHVHQATTADRAEREALVERVTADLSRRGRRPFVIGVGGSGATGAIGQVLAGLELAEQAQARRAEPELVVVPSATGGTQAGLIAGLRLAGLSTSVVGVAVAHPSAELRPTVDALLAELGELVGRDLREPIELDESYLAPGYGRSNPAADEATALLARTEGILVDPIYTAKAMAWLVDRARGGQLDGQRVVFWHAGGTLGLFEPLEE